MIKPMMQDRLINPLEGAGDAPDSNIRPALLAEYIGQPVVREQMEVFIGAAGNLGPVGDEDHLAHGGQVF